MDIYGSYVTFSLTSRLPAGFSILTVASLAFFIGGLAFHASPAATFVLCILAGMLITLQYLIYGIHSLLLFVARVFKSIRNSVLRAFAAVFGARPAPASAPTDAENAFGEESPAVIHASPAPAYTDLSWLSPSTPAPVDGKVVIDAPARPPRNPARHAAKTRVTR